MQLLQETADGTDERKFIKSQVEKRRRERMNRSLERLRTMLLQEPQQLAGPQRRVEKAEILEHTVLFLQKIAKGDKAEAGDAGDGGGGQKHSFQDGISTCLQRAAHFLGPEGKGLRLGAALDASFAARLSRSDSDSSGVQVPPRSPSGSLPHTKSILRMLRQKSKHRLNARASSGRSLAHPYEIAAQQAQQQAQRQNQRDSKQSPSQICPVSQSLWRPWH